MSDSCWGCLRSLRDDEEYWCSHCAPVVRTCHCGQELERGDLSGFCSVACERGYGECNKCGGPLRGGGTCHSCKEP